MYTHVIGWKKKGIQKYTKICQNLYFVNIGKTEKRRL